MHQPIRGFKDVIDFTESYNAIYNASLLLAKQCGFVEGVMPAVEKASLFERNLGEESDINLKELYKFNFFDETLALRPEFTAGIARMISSMDGFCKNHSHKNGLNLFSFGPVFRHDRPQAGRYRQFFQANFESYKNSSYLCDVFGIALACNLLQFLDAFPEKTPQQKQFEVQINTLGSVQTKLKYQDILTEYFTKYKAELSADSLVRLQKNPIRILDSKDEADRKLLANVPQIQNCLSPEELARIENIISSLQTIVPSNFAVKHCYDLVRGLDYYTSTVFEIKPANNGLTLLAGGRYDNLIEQISGGAHNVSAFGFACGVERLIEFFDINTSSQKGLQVKTLEGLLDSAKNGKKIAILCMANSLEVPLVLAKYLKAASQKIVSEGGSFAVFEVQKSLSKTLTDLSEQGFYGAIIVGKNELQNPDNFFFEVRVIN